MRLLPDRGTFLTFYVIVKTRSPKVFQDLLEILDRQQELVAKHVQVVILPILKGRSR